jgi:electron transport complex protein RnfD
MYWDGSGVASALVLTLILPNQIHPIFAFLGAMFAMVVVKHSFGGLGCNWVNPALGAWLFIRFGWPGAFTDALKDSAFTIPVTSLAQVFMDPNGAPLVIQDTFWTPLLNRTIFSLTSSKLPEGYIDFLVFSGPGIIVDRGLLAFLFGTIIITAGQVGRSWIPLCYLGVYCFLIRLFGGGDMLFGLFTGGTMVAAFILAADPSTGPKSRIGVLITVVLGALLSFIFRYWGFEFYGAFFAVVLLNALVPFFRYVEIRFLYTGISGGTGGVHAGG